MRPFTSRAALAALVALLVVACAPSRDSDPSVLPSTTAAPEWFVERAREYGLDFVHFNGRSGERYMAEVLGAGAALFDYDGDGDLDALLVQGAMLGPGKSLADALVPPAPGVFPLSDRLFRNDLTPGSRGELTPRFVDVTQEAGLSASVGYGMGVATGDYDGDGDEDLFITRFGGQQLWRNRGDGTFEDQTHQAGVAGDRFAAPATFFDFNRDGRLDLFVGNYVDFSYASHRTCFGPGGAVDYCGPASYRALPDRLFVNQGNGSFIDVTTRSGIAGAYGPALGAIAVDIDGDGWQELYVANDGAANQLWINQKDGTFRDEALIAGCAVNGAGVAEAGMGVDAGDVDADGDWDLFITHLGGETNTLFVNQGGSSFVDGTRTSELGAPSFPFTGFGTGFFDADNDGWVDVFVANGAIRDLPALVEKGDPFPLHEPNQLFHNRGNGTFAEVSGEAGAALALSEVSRGVAAGDIDQDGDVDLLVTNNGGPARLLINQRGALTGWLGLAVLTASGSPRLGTEVRLETAGRMLLRRVHTDGSYLSANDSRLIFGLGAASEVRYPVRLGGPEGMRLLGLGPGRYYQIRR